MNKEHLDLDNGVVWIPDSKTVNGVAEVPLTDIAVEAFRRQIAISGPGPLFFPSEDDPGRHQISEKRSKPFGVPRCAAQPYHIFGFTICDRRTQLDSAPAESPTNL